MADLDSLPTPALVVDLDVLEGNIAAMQERCRRLGVRLRPHVKTHKCVEIGRMQQAAGGAGITVATLHEAEVFATAGFDDITWAFPAIPSRLPQLAELAERVQMGVVVDHPGAVRALADAGVPARVWIKVDCGYHRCGVPAEDRELPGLADAITDAGLELVGLLSHSGDAYDRPGREARESAIDRERSGLVAAAARLEDAGHPVGELSLGSTPGMTAARSLDGISEVRPGNYAYFDLTQVALGSCDLADCALSVVATVVSTARDHSVVDAGALALSKDTGGSGVEGYGGIYASLESRRLRDDVRIVGLSQEHGKLDRSLPYGERLRIAPNHSCLTAACFTRVHAVRGTEVVDRWRVWNGR